MAGKDTHETEAVACTRCGGKMEEGTLFYTGQYGEWRPMRWFKGGLEPPVLVLFEEDKQPIFNVRTYRCEECGRLESFAREPA